MIFLFLVFFFSIELLGAQSFRLLIESNFATTEKESSIFVLSKDLEEFNVVIPFLQDSFNCSDFQVRHWVWNMLKRAHVGVYTMNEYEQKQLHGMEHNAKALAHTGIANLSKIFMGVLITEKLSDSLSLMKSSEYPILHYWVCLAPERAEQFFDSVSHNICKKSFFIHCIAARNRMRDPENPFLGTTKVVCPLVQKQELFLKLREQHQKEIAKSKEKVIVGYISCKNEYGNRQFLPLDISDYIKAFLR